MPESQASTGRCPTNLCGVWHQERSRCESLCPLLEGLGLPKSLLWAACPIADRMQTTLRISCPQPGHVEIVDKTAFGRNSTLAATDGTEVEHLTRGRKKPFMLSATADGPAGKERLVLQCRLVSRGDGWYTRQERALCDDGNSLLERHVLVRPGLDDVVIDRHFSRGSDEDLRPAPSGQ